MADEPLSSERKDVDFAGKEVDQNFDAPIIFVDGIQGFAVTQPDIVRFNLVQDLMKTAPIGRPALDEPVLRRVSARLVMSLDQFLKIHDWTNRVVSDMKNSGILKETPSLPGKSEDGAK